MIRKTISIVGRVSLLVLVGFFAFAYLVSGLEPRRAPVSASASAVSHSPASSEDVSPPEIDLATTGIRDDETLLDPAKPDQNNANDLQLTIESLNRCFEREWAIGPIEIAESADWATVCRRISLAMVGSGMSLEEFRRLERLPEEKRVSNHLEKLFSDPRFHDYWAERFTRVYVGAEDGPFIAFRRRRFRSWLSDQFAANQRYDQIVRNLITATGLWTDRPEVNFLTVTLGTNEEGQPDPIRLAARTTRAFLGLRIDCLQCHDDFLGYVSLGEGDALREGKQTDFHSLAAFYSSARLNGLQGIRNQSHPYEYQYLNANETTIVEPAVPYAPDLLPKDGEPRERLAAWMTHPENKQAARAAVSRVWALMFGKPITKAVDNIPLNDAVHPAIDLLAEDFVTHDFDLRRLIRIIASSRVYQLDSAADFEITDRHEDAWAVFPLTRLRPEQVAGSVIQAARIKTVDRDSSLLVQLMKFGGVNDFVTRYGDIGEDEFDQDNVTITQRLIMLNGKLVNEYSGENPVLNASSHILMFCESDSEAVDATYLSVLNRFPSADERAVFTTRLSESDNRKNAMTDLFWVLLNSSELVWNH